MARRTQRRTTKKYTLNEFKAWLDGIVELQPDDWSPDADQWKTIYTKMMNIVEPDIHQQPDNIDQTPSQPEIPVGKGEPPPVNSPPLPPFQSSLAPPPSELTPAAKAALAGKLPSEMATSPDGKVKTPNIDTSDGDYESSFT